MIKTVYIGAMCLALAGASAAQASTESMRPGNAGLQPGSLRPGTDTVQSFRLEDGTKVQVASIIRTITSEKRGTTPVFRLVVRNLSGLGDTSRTETVIDARSFALISQKVRATADSGEVSVIDGNIKGWTDPSRDSLRRFEFKHVAATFPDDGDLPWLVTTLPLDTGKTFEGLAFNMWIREERPLGYAVVREDTVRYHGNLDTCWVIKVTGRGGPPGFDHFNWVSKRTRQLLQAAFIRPDALGQFWIRRQ